MSPQMAAEPAPEAQYASPPVDWNLLVEQIKSGEPAGMEQLYRIFGRGIRRYLRRRLAPHEADDRFNDTFVVVIDVIQNGDLREPERLMGFVGTVVRRQVAAQIDSNIQRRGVADVSSLDLEALVDDPERQAWRNQRRELLTKFLLRIHPRDREILTRFYLHEQTQEQIQEEMGLTYNQFRLFKSRALARMQKILRCEAPALA